MRELDLRQPTLVIPNCKKGGKDTASSSSSGTSSGTTTCQLIEEAAATATADIANLMVEATNAAAAAFAVAEGSLNAEDSVQQQQKQQKPASNTPAPPSLNGSIAAMIQHETSLASTLQHTPLVRRMRYRGDVRVLSRALVSSPCLSRLLALDLCECNLTPLAARSLAAAFMAGVTPRLGHLDLSDNPQLGESGAEAIGLAIQKGSVPLLQGLLLFGDKIQAGGGVAIAQAIGSGALPRLEILDLSGNTLGTEAALELAKALEAKHCPQLTQLGLSDNNVEQEGIEALASALGTRASAGCAKLEKLHLGGNIVGPRAARKLGEALQQDGCGEKMALLELHSARLGGVGIRVIAEVMKAGAINGLKELWVDDNMNEDDDSGEAMQDVMSVLAGGALPLLEAIGLNWSSLGGTVGLAAALTTFPRPNLHRLDLRSTSISGPGLAPLADALCNKVCPNLRWLDLSGNALFLAGACELARALEGGAGKNLRRLDLHAVGLESDGVKELARVLKKQACPELMGLGLALNRITASGAAELGEAMSAGGLAKLVGLELHKNELGDQGVKIMTHVLVRGACPLLLYLGLSVNRIGNADPLMEAIRAGKIGCLERLNLQDNFLTRHGLKICQETVCCVAGRGGKLRLELQGNGKAEVKREAGWILKGTKRTMLGLVVGGGAIMGAVAVNVVVEQGGGLTPLMRGVCVVGLGMGGMCVGGLQCGGLVRAWGEQGAGGGGTEGVPTVAMAEDAAATAATAAVAGGGVGEVDVTTNMNHTIIDTATTHIQPPQQAEATATIAAITVPPHAHAQAQGPAPAPAQATPAQQAPLTIFLVVMAGDVAVTATGLGGGWLDLFMFCAWTFGLLVGYVAIIARQ